MRYLLLLVFIFSSCTSGPKKPTSSFSNDSEDWAPGFKFYKSHKDDSPENLSQLSFNKKSLQRWQQYSLATKLALSNPKQACLIWETLGQDKKFALARLSLLRRNLTCPQLITTESALIDLNADEKFIYEELLADKLLQESKLTATPDDNVEALLNKARLISHYQEREELYKAAVSEAQKSKNRDLINKTLHALYKNSPRLNPAPNKDELKAVANNHRTWRQFDPAINIYRSIFNSTAHPEEKYFALKSIRQTLKTAERREAYVQSTAKMARWTYDQWKKSPMDLASQKRLYDSQLLLSRTLWTEDRTKQAIKALEDTEKWLKGLYPLDELYFIRGRIAEEKKDYELALMYFKKASEEKVSQKNLRDKILWNQSWLLYKTKKCEEALIPLSEIIQTSTEIIEKNKSLYWKARCLTQINKNSEAEQTYETLIKSDPLGYYGLLAYRDLKKEIPVIRADEDPSFDERLSAARVSSNYRDQVILIDWLVAVGEHSLAERALNRFSDDLRKNNISDEDLWLRVFSQYAQSGLYIPLFSALTQLKPEIREDILKSHPEFLFPRSYKEFIEVSAAKAEVPSALVYSIIRQESAFNPKARSGMDAYGLMQLLPSIAKVRAKEAKVSFTKATDLYNPEINVALGAFELRSLLKRYKDEFIMAIAAYNANEKALKGWLRQRYSTDPIEFIEEVPYEETRSYLKLVLRNYVFYLRMQNEKPFLFPESCLRLSQDHK